MVKGFHKHIFMFLVLALMFTSCSPAEKQEAEGNLDGNVYIGNSESAGDTGNTANNEGIDGNEAATSNDGAFANEAVASNDGAFANEGATSNNGAFANEAVASNDGVFANEGASTDDGAPAAKKQTGAALGNQQAQSDTEPFRAAIRLYDEKEGKAAAYSSRLAMRKQSFILDFSLPADKDSVEKAISDNILNMWRGEYVKPIKPALNFDWISDTTLILTADNLTHNSYCIYLKDSKDKTGMHLISDEYTVDDQGVHFNILEFEILDRQKICIFNPETLKYGEVPLDSRYHYAYGTLSPSGKTAFIGRMLYDFEAVYYMPSFIDLDSGRITDMTDDSFIDISGNWVGEKLLWYNKLLDAKTGANDMAFNAQVLSSLMLRNGGYISLTVANESGGLVLTRYDAGGLPSWSKKLPDYCGLRIWEGGFLQRPVLYELEDGSIITTFFNNESQTYSVYGLNTSSTENPAALLHENSFIAAVSPDAMKYALYVDIQNSFISSRIEIHSPEGLEKTIVDEELAKNMCIFWQNNKFYVCNSGYPDHVYIHIIDVATGKGRTVRPKVAATVSGFIGITPEDEVVMIESCYSMALFR